MKQKFVAYYRVSTTRQGEDGLGIAAQREAVAQFVAMKGGQIVAEHVEVMSGSDNARPQLQAALGAARVHNAILVVARLDRLSRDSLFLKTLLRSGAEIAFANMPQIPAGAVGTFLLGLLSEVSELERGMIADRTRQALQAAKRRGVRLGGLRSNSGVLGPIGGKASGAARAERARTWAAAVLPLIRDLQQAGATTASAVANALNAQGVRTRAGATWRATQVQRVMRIAGGAA